MEGVVQACNNNVNDDAEDHSSCHSQGTSAVTSSTHFTFIFVNPHHALQLTAGVPRLRRVNCHTSWKQKGPNASPGLSSSR